MCVNKFIFIENYYMDISGRWQSWHYWSNCLAGNYSWVGGWELEVKGQKGKVRTCRSQGITEITASVQQSLRCQLRCQDWSEGLRLSGDNFEILGHHSYWGIEGRRDPYSCCPWILKCHRKAVCKCLFCGETIAASNNKNNKFQTLHTASLQEGWI